MNLKAIYYALSRMFLPTLSVILLSLMWSLSPSKTFSFLLSENTWAGVIRIVLLIAEMFWFYYLYTSFLENEELNEGIKEVESKGTLDYYAVENFVKTNSPRNQAYNVKYLKNQNVFIIKHFDRPSDY